MKSMNMMNFCTIACIIILLVSGCIETQETTSTTTSSTPSTTTSSSTSTTSTVTTSSTTTTTIPRTSKEVRIIETHLETEHNPKRLYLNEEWIEIKNFGDKEVNLSGWILRNRNFRRKYVFPGFVLDANESVRIHTGSGINSENELYMCFRSEMWDDEFEIITLLDSNGTLIDKMIVRS
ncbi:MAG: hypothetical protein DRO95_05815 [Candidatus Altiarchaeales archaeon]|nr:MAG: hypothetical protein DRO95_05815 [Candidatus Altiarchaeales archaeon]